ncbi:MAG: rRNA pseudouridine synthase [Cellulomonas sp.]|uniref:pseudouridine synthase n=1 Tax=Cellulomonas sp. TaxID=40001 RepID=UPI00258FC180|nr:pseudouridine synthase [Cellulomonas sp.]MCR6703467.1 rRNA pseudouridine synthase [Cellulomonas sp.]
MSPQQRRGDADRNGRPASRDGAPRGGASGRGGAAGGEGKKPHRGQSGAARGPVKGRSSRPTSSRPTTPRRAPSEPTVDVHDPEGIRLQKLLASAGLGSRRACETLIASGRVEVDGQVVAELGVRVDPKKSVVLVDGMRVQLDSSHVTIALNKPKGVVSTMHDEQGRPSVAQYVSDRTERLFHVGRLDADTEGLLLLTSDGELANHLSHPSNGVPKTYLAEVQGRLTPATAQRLQRGIELEDGPAKADKVTIVQSLSHLSLVELTLHEGRNRIVRRMLEEVGHPVTKLVRTRIGPIRLGDLKQGRTRVLSQVEIGSLMSQAGM